MQLKGLVRFFAIALILICIYQLSFTWIVNSHEKAMAEKAEKQTAALPKPAVKYANDAALQAIYADSLKAYKEERLQRLLDSTKDTKIGPFSLTTYRSAKDKELLLGLDLQGGMSVTMEVGLDALLRSLANYTKDGNFNKALETAVAKKANSGADLITLFTEEYKKVNPTGTLATLFTARSNGKVKFNDSDATVTNYLREQALAAFDNTFRILRTRIDKFGVASPTINPDPAKGIISIELAGANDPERIRRYLQSTANLQFFEVYNLNEIGEAFVAADKATQAYLNGASVIDTTTNDSTTTAKNDTSKNKNPMLGLVQINQPFQGKNGQPVFPASIGYIRTTDTGLLNKYLRLDVVANKFPANLQFMFGKVDTDDPKSKNILQLYAIKTLDNGRAELEGEHVTEAKQDYDERGKVAIKMNMDKVGSNIWAKMTGRNIGKPIAIVLDNFVYSAPNVNDAITTGSSQISGSYSVKEAQDLSEILTSGKLTAPAKIVQEQVVGPTLGAAAIKGGTMSFAISFAVIFILMLVYYNTGGWVANIALILNLLFTIGILSALGFTLTAPGIAGLVLTIGMAVDTNVIIFERIKEELTKGKSYTSAVNDGYKRSLAPVLDAHVTTLLTAIILAYFGLGPVLGFATTQIIGILLSLFCGILVSRLITDIYAGGKSQKHFQYFTAISQRIFKHAAYKFIEYRKIAYIISVVVLIGGVAAIFNGFDKGVEFEGGRSYTIKFDKAVNQEDISTALKTAFGEAPIIKTVGGANQLNITTAYKIEASNANNTVDTEVENKLFEGLKAFLPAGTSYEVFDTKYKQSSQTVLPTISDDLKMGAIKATVFSILIICFYIFIRFRDWRYSVGTIVALLHDVLVTLIVFSFARSFVSFPLEIDQHFIAAILTVIGFSMNDTVIVYDRIREDSKLYPNLSKEQLINTAINQTLSRTIMTSLTVFLTILILFIFGGEVTRGFAFAMLIGVITGTYSSIFVAAPILVDFAKNKPLGKQSK
jgi:SecD/SecF fusion protein